MINRKLERAVVGFAPLLSHLGIEVHRSRPIALLRVLFLTYDPPFLLYAQVKTNLNTTQEDDNESAETDCSSAT